MRVVGVADDRREHAVDVEQDRAARGIGPERRERLDESVAAADTRQSMAALRAGKELRVVGYACSRRRSAATLRRATGTSVPSRMTSTAVPLSWARSSTAWVRFTR